MAKVDVPVTIKVVVDYPSKSPRMTELQAKAVVRKAIGEEFDRIAAQRQLSCTDWQDEPTEPSGKAYPTSSAEMQKAIGTGNWSAGWLCDDASGLAPVFGEVKTLALYCPPPGTPAPAFGDVVGPMHIMMAGADHCGDADCQRCDPLDRMVDGLTVRECLAAYSARMRADLSKDGSRFSAKFKNATEGGTWLTDDQKQAAQQAWSAELKRKQQEAREKERCVVCVDDDRWEP